MRLIERVQEYVRNHNGADTVEVTEALFPEMTSWERDARRCTVYARLHELERYGLVVSETVSTGNGGHGLKQWYWVGEPCAD